MSQGFAPSQTRSPISDIDEAASRAGRSGFAAAGFASARRWSGRRGHSCAAERCDTHVRRDKMNQRNILSVSATIALGLALLGITTGSTASAAEIKLLSASALHPAIDALIPDFEKSSGHKVTVSYETAGAVAERVIKGEAADVVTSSVPV